MKTYEFHDNTDTRAYEEEFSCAIREGCSERGARFRAERAVAREHERVIAEQRNSRLLWRERIMRYDGCCADFD
jgi:hypothetical protein